MKKTNVMRILDRAHVAYRVYDYVDKGVVSGVDVALALGLDPNMVFKTLITQSKNGLHCFLIPVVKTLDLKKAAHAVVQKRIELVRHDDLFSLTGYVHGGCSPIGLPKVSSIVIDEEAKNHPTIVFSAGKIGYQVEVAFDDLSKVIQYQLDDLTKAT